MTLECKQNCKCHEIERGTITGCEHCQPKPTTDEWAEFDKEFAEGVKANIPWYVIAPEIKEWVNAHFISRSELVAEGERMKKKIPHKHQNPDRFCAECEEIFLYNLGIDDLISIFK